MAQASSEAPPTVVIQATRGLSALQLGALWEYCEIKSNLARLLSTPGSAA